MRNFIEIRNHDCVGGDLKYAILAIYKGILYSNFAMSECEELFKGLQYKDFEELRFNVPKNTLQSRVRKAKALDYAKEIIGIAQRALKEEQTGEELFLDSIKEFTHRGVCPADVIVKNWNGSWNRNMAKLIKYLSEFE